MRPIQRKFKNRADLKTLRNLHGTKKLQYLWDYFKLPLLLLGILLYVVVYSCYRHFTDKTPILYTALVNVNAGETLTTQLGTDFLNATGADISHDTLRLYQNLYLTDDENNPYHEYTYASRLKLLAAIDDEQLDIVLMDREAFDAFSQNGYLCNIEALLSDTDASFYEAVKPYITDNIYIEEDNAFELQFDPSLTYSAVTKEYPMGLNFSEAKLIQQAGFDGDVYVGIIANSPRVETALSYLEYLFYGDCWPSTRISPAHTP